MAHPFFLPFFPSLPSIVNPFLFSSSFLAFSPIIYSKTSLTFWFVLGEASKKAIPNSNTPLNGRGGIPLRGRGQVMQLIRRGMPMRGGMKNITPNEDS